MTIRSVGIGSRGRYTEPAMMAESAHYRRNRASSLAGRWGRLGAATHAPRWGGGGGGSTLEGERRASTCRLCSVGRLMLGPRAASLMSSCARGRVSGSLNGIIWYEGSQWYHTVYGVTMVSHGYEGSQGYPRVQRGKCTEVSGCSGVSESVRILRVGYKSGRPLLCRAANPPRQRPTVSVGLTAG